MNFVRSAPALCGVTMVALAACTPAPSAPAMDAAADAPRDASTDDGPRGPAPTGELSTVLRPQQTPEYYVAQANLYFDTLDTRADPTRVPNYSLLSARWEWPPWWKLTGYGRDMIVSSTRDALTHAPSTVPVRDCRAFTVQPFARCYVSFEYARGRCPIYEEFTFNNQGETTFVEAWSDLPGFRPMPDPADRWAEGPGVHRLSTRVPGLGNATGLIDPEGEWMQRAAREDPEIADFARRPRDFWRWWFQALSESGPNSFERGCGWSIDGGAP